MAKGNELAIANRRLVVILLSIMTFSVIIVPSMKSTWLTQKPSQVPIAGLAHVTGLNYSVSFSLSDLSFSRVEKNGSDYDVVELSSCSFMSRVGEPMLPVRGVQLVVPADAEAEAVTVLSSNSKELSGTYNIFPAQPPQSVGFYEEDRLSEPEFVEPTEALYASSEYYPGILVEYVGDGHMAGYHLISLSVYPLQYSPSEKRLVLYTTITFQVNLKPSTVRALEVARRTSSSQGLYESMVKNLVDNPSDVDAFSPQIKIVDLVARPFEPAEFPSTSGSPVEYVIVTNDSLSTNFQRLADWKTLKGIPTVVRTVQWIEANYAGCDLQERIRNFVKEAYLKWGTQWILLGGDTDIIPERKAESMAAREWYASCDIPTDLYYSDLDGNWNADGDAYFGNATDNVDLNPDVYVGRAPVNEAAEAEVFINKILAYEKNPDPTYITTALLMAVAQWGGEVCKNYVATNCIPSDFNIWNLNQSVGPNTDHTFNHDNALYRMNMGYHFINHIDHSGVNAMGTCVSCPCPLCDGNIGISDMDSLTNDGKFSILWTFGCSPNAFDHDSVSEHFILNPSGGGVAFIGNTREGTGYQDCQDKQFFQSIFDDAFFHYSLHHIGAAFASTLGRTVHGTQLSAEYSFLMNLLGDPEMPVWTNTPGSLNVHVDPSAMLIGLHSVTVTVKDTGTGTPVESATVCLFKEGEVYTCGVTDASGTVSFTVKPNTSGMGLSGILMTVTTQNYLPYEGNLNVYPIGLSNSPYLFYEGHVVDDSASAFPDGAVDAGETVRLPVTLKNGGTGPNPASNVGGTLSLWTADPYVTITGDNQVYGNIPAMGTATCFPGFAVDVSPSCPDEHEAEFCLTITDANGNEWKDNFTICVMAPNLWHSRNGVYDMNWPDGVIQPGETVDLSINVTNGRLVTDVGWAGHGVAIDVAATLSTTNPDITITQGSVDIGNILPKEEKLSLQRFIFTVSSTWPGGDLGFTLTMSDSMGRSWVHDFELTPPAAPTGLATIPGKTSIELAWSPNTETDLAGYNVYLLGFGDKRLWAYYIEPPRLNTLPVNSSCYTHMNLASGAGYDYMVAAVDSSGNEGPRSMVREWTNPEDQLGWPKSIQLYGRIDSSPAIANLDGDLANGLEIVVGSFWDGNLYAWHQNGDIVSGWPVSTGGWPKVIAGSPAIGDIDNNGDLEVVIAAGNRVYAWHHDGTPVNNFPFTVSNDAGSVPSTPAIGDIDHAFNGLEVVVTTSNAFVYVIHNDGSLATGWPVQVSTTWGMRSSPAVGDIDGDNEMEIVVVGNDLAANGFVYGKGYALKHDGSPLGYSWPTTMGAIWGGYGAPEAECAPSLGDIDGDNEIEIIAQDLWRTYVWDYMGNEENGWQGGKPGGNMEDCSPALGNLDNDGDLEIVVGSKHKKVYAWHHNGDQVAGWPQETKCGTAHNPIIGDVDGDGQVEIMVGSDNEKIHAWHVDGTKVLGWPIKTGWFVKSTPALGDVDFDGNVEVVVGSHDSNVYVWDCDCPHTSEWGTFRHDLQRTGSYSPHKVAITNVAPFKTVMGRGYPLFINVTVTNEGHLLETFNVTIYANATIIATAANITLMGGNSTIISFTWNTTGLACGRYFLSSYATPVPGETDTLDNTFAAGWITIAIPGDIKANGNVDIYDAIMLANAYNSRSGHPNWNSDADINVDNIVDIYDAIILAGNFGKHCS